jgi:hypothetical protein
MDGFLPPVDVGGWLEFQRKRAKQLAQERIDQANQAVGAAAGVGRDWIGRATQSIDGLLPDWAEGAEPPHTPEPAPSPPPSLNAVQDWGAGALDRIGQLGSGVSSAIDQAQGIVPSAAGLQDFSDRQAANLNTTADRYAAERPELPYPAGVVAGAGGEAWQGLGRVQQKTRQAVDTMAGFGPQGANLPAQIGAGVQVGTTPYTIGGEVAGELAGAAGGLPETQAAAQGAMSVAGPGGTIGSIRGGLEANAPAWLRGAAAAGAPIGAGIGIGTGIAAGAPPEEVLSRGFEGANMGAGAGELAATALPAAGRGLAGLADRFGTEADPRFGIVKRETYDPTGINPVQGRLAARGAPGRAPGPAMLGPVTPEEAAKIKRGGYGAEYTGPPLSADPFPPGPGPNGEYTIPHPTGPDMVAAPPAPGTYLTSDGYLFWQRVVNGETPYRADYEQSVRELRQPKYPWDTYNSPPPEPGSPGYGRMDQGPLAAPDWDTRLADWAPRNGTDPVTLRHLLNRYAMNERFPREAVDDLAPSHPDLATPEARAAAEADLNEALNRARARRSKNEDRAIASERNTRKAPGEDADGAATGEPDTGDGTYSYTSKKGVTPDGEEGGEFHFTSSYEVASAMKFDADPDVVSWQKGSGPRGRVRLVIDPKYGYNPNSEALMANSDPGPGSEVIYSPDFLVTFKDGSQKVVETKNVGIYNLPAWRIEAKTTAGQEHFENNWGVGFMMMAEDQIGRPFMRDLATADLARLPAGHPLRRLRATDVADFQKKMVSAAKASRGGLNDPMLMDAAQHLMDLNAASKYPPSAALDDTQNVQQYMSAARAQAEWHNSTPADGTTFSVDGQNIPLAPGLGGYMVSITPPWQRLEYAGHRIEPYRLAQFRHENALIFDLFPDARVGTFKSVDKKGNPITYVDVSVRRPDGQSAAETANLFRQQMVYNRDSTTNVPIARPEQQWVGRNQFDEWGAYERYKRILGDEADRAGRGEAVSKFPELRGLPGDAADLARIDAETRRTARFGAARPGAARRRGAVSGVPGAGAGDAEGAGVLGAGGDVQPRPGGGLPPAEAPGLPPDGRGSDGLGGPGGAGIAAQPGDGTDWRSALDAALAGVAPYGAARTGGERVFDLAAGTAGGVAGAATADEDATWQERAKRFGAGAVAGSLVGPTARGGLGQLAGRELTDRSTFGAAAGRSGGPQRPGGRFGRALADLPELLSAVPLASPTSQLANFTSGMARTAERVAGVAFEGRPIDALVDLAAMVRSVPGGVRETGKAFKAGPSARTPGMLGAAAPGDLVHRGGVVPNVLTGGVRANAALDEFWRTVNEAGAGAQAARRGLRGQEAADYTTRAGDFATWGGPNTIVAKKLTEMKNTVRDPKADLGDRISAGILTSMAPYVMMPERLLRATVGNLIPIEAGVGLGRALKRGDKAAAREYMGRALAGLSASYAIWKAWENGGVTGDAPENPTERRRREAQGAKWNTFAVPGGARVPTRYLGSLGMQMDALATTLDAAKAAEEKGGDPGAVLENGFDAGARWFLGASYLSDLVDFGADIKSPQGAAGAIRRLAAAQPSRLTGPVTNAINAADPYEREAETFPEMVAARTGLRAAVPTRIDPTTGEDQRRRGTGLSRYFGERGVETTAEGDELTRLGLTPRVIGRTEKYEGAVQSRDARREAQRALGREVGPAVRGAMAKPDYVKLSEEEQTAEQRRALLQGGDEADIDLGEQVARGSKQQAQRAYDALPHFVGIDPKASPDDIRRQNEQVQRAQTVAAQYREKYGEGPWRSRMAKEEPELYKLVGRPRIPAPVLENQRKKIETQYGVKLG